MRFLTTIVVAAVILVAIFGLARNPSLLADGDFWKWFTIITYMALSGGLTVLVGAASFWGFLLLFALFAPINYAMLYAFKMLPQPHLTRPDLQLPAFLPQINGMPAWQELAIASTLLGIVGLLIARLARGNSGGAAAAMAGISSATCTSISMTSAAYLAAVLLVLH